MIEFMLTVFISSVVSILIANYLVYGKKEKSDV